ncbi:hypothetical protein BSKO_05324 [Bryopsis sp. KO-2023]|nr:hypothetical protein BSKO_05324 [Bryopsis sp. KO-2023]
MNKKAVAVAVIAIVAFRVFAVVRSAQFDNYVDGDPHAGTCERCDPRYNLLSPNLWAHPHGSDGRFGTSTYTKPTYRLPNQSTYKRGFQDTSFKNGMMFTRGSVLHGPYAPARPDFAMLKRSIHMGSRLEASWIKIDRGGPDLDYSKARPHGGALHYMILTRAKSPRYSPSFPLKAPEESIAVLWTPEFLQLQTPRINPPFSCSKWEVDFSLTLTVDGVSFESSCGVFFTTWEDAGVSDVDQDSKWNLFMGADCDGESCEKNVGWAGTSCLSLLDIRKNTYALGTYSYRSSDFLPSLATVDTHSEELCIGSLPARAMFLGAGNAHYHSACEAPICANTGTNREPWITLDLGRFAYVDFVVIKNSFDMGPLADFELRIGNSKEWQYNEPCPHFEAAYLALGARMTFACGGFGRYVTLRRTGHCVGLSVCEFLPYGKKTGQCATMTSSDVFNANLESKFVFTEVSQSYETTVGRWPHPVEKKPRGTVYFKGHILFSTPAEKVEEHDLVVPFGHVVKVHISADSCSAELFGYLTPPWCRLPNTDVPRYLCIQSTGRIHEAFLQRRHFPAGKPHCVEIPHSEYLACQKAVLSPISSVQVTSEGPATSEDHALLAAQFSFKKYITKDWFTIYGPYGAKIESIYPSTLEGTYYLDVGLHFPYGKAKVCFNHHYLKDIRMYPAGCLEITKKNITGSVTVSSSGAQLSPLEIALPVSPAISTGVHIKDPKRVVITRLGDRSHLHNEAAREYYRLADEAFDHEKEVRRHGKKKSIFDVFTDGFHSIMSEQQGPTAAIDTRLKHYHDYHSAPSTTKKGHGSMLKNFGWEGLEGSAIDDALRSLALTKDPSESLPTVLHDLGFVLNHDTVSGGILGYDGLLTCLDYAKTDDGLGVNTVRLLLCSHLPEFLRPSLIRLLLEKKHIIIEPEEVLSAVLPNKSSAERVLDHPIYQAMIQELFNRCLAFAVEGEEQYIDYEGCLRPAGFVFDKNSALVKVTPAWIDILDCLEYARSSGDYDDRDFRFDLRKLSQCRVQPIPATMAAHFSSKTYLQIIDIAQLIFPRSVTGKLESIAIEGDAVLGDTLKHVLLEIKHALCSEPADSCLTDFGIIINNNKIQGAPAVFRKLIATLLNSIVALDIGEDKTYYVRVQRMFNANLPIQHLASLEPKILVKLISHYAYVGTRLNDAALKEVKQLVLERGQHGERYQYDNLKDPAKQHDEPFYLLQAIYPFIHDTLPLRDVVLGMFATNLCPQGMRTETGAKIINQVLRADESQRNTKIYGVELAAGKVPYVCSSGWNDIWEVLEKAHSSKQGGKPFDSSIPFHFQGRKLQKAYQETRYEFESDILCVNGYVEFDHCTAIAKSTGVDIAENLGVDTPEIDTIEELVTSDLAGFLQALTVNQADCLELNCEGIPLCLDQVGLKFADDNCRSVAGATPDFFSFVSCAFVSEQPASELQFDVHQFLQCIVDQAEIGDVAALALAARLSGGDNRPVSAKRLLQIWPMFICLSRCGLGKTCALLHEIALELQDFERESDTGALDLTLASFSCSPDAYSSILFQLQRVKGMKSHAGKSLDGVPHNDARLNSCLESLRVSQGELLKCGIKTIANVNDGADMTVSNLPLLACLACSLDRYFGEGYDIQVEDDDLAEAGTEFLGVISLPEAVIDPAETHHMLAESFGRKNERTRLDLVRFLLENVNMFYYEVDSNPGLASRPAEYNDAFNKVMHFTVSFHKKVSDGGLPPVDAAILSALLHHMRPLEALRNHESNSAVFLGSMLGSTFRPCAYGSTCSPDISLAQNKYLPFLQTLNRGGNEELSPEMFQALGDILNYVDLSTEDMLQLLGLDFGKIGKDAADGLHALFPAIEKLVGANDGGGSLF